MESEGPHVVEHAADMLSAARQLADSAAHPSNAIHLSAALARVEETLEALSLAFERAPHSLVPTGDPREPVCRRFERAAADWPRAYGLERPSHERQAQLVCSLYEAGAALRLSRRACVHANELLTELTCPKTSTSRESVSDAVSSGYAV